MDVIVVGSANIDDIVRVDHIAQPGETIASRAHVVRAGGKGANQAVAAARAGAHVRFVGKIGADGDWVLDRLRALGVDDTTRCIRTDKVLTGRAWIQVDAEGDNAIVLLPGANHEIDTDDVRHIFTAVTASVLLLQNEISSLSHILTAGHARGCTIVLNAAPFTPALIDLPLHLVHVLIVNETEGRALAALSDTHEAPPSQIATTLALAMPRAEIIVTLGARGVIGRNPSDPPDQLVHIAATPVERVVETTGAGDTFTGYFVVARLVRRLPFPTALRIAATAAAICVQQPGAMDSIPVWDAVTLTGVAVQE